MKEQSQSLLRVARIRHRREARLYILLPLGVSILCVLSLLFLITGAEGENFSQIAALATIWLILPLLLLQLLLLILLLAKIYLLHRALKGLPGAALRFQLRLYHGYGHLNRMSDWLVRPIFALHEGWSALRTIFDFRRLWMAWKSGGSEWKRKR